jgi:hypothetical protein
VALTPKQERFAELVAAGRSQQKAAEAVKISPRQARNWLRDNPEVRELINGLSVEAQRQAVTVLSTLLMAAAETMGEMLKPKHPASIRLAAARGVIADFVALRQYVDLVAEMQQVKEAIHNARGVKAR